MPNCDFYAIGSDIDCILEYIFRESNCRVFESYSSFESNLVEFNSLSDVKVKYPFLGACQGNGPSVLLQLWQVNAGSATIKKIKLNPNYCDGSTFRYCLSGWGLIQFYIGGLTPDGVNHSHTNHNSAKRAAKWEDTHLELGGASEWDWKLIESTSRKINNFIKKKAVTKHLRRYALPEAARVMGLS